MSNSPLKRSHKIYKNFEKKAANQELIGVDSLKFQKNTVTDFRWNDKKLEAASMISEGYLLNQVAEKIDIDASTISRWSRHPDFIKHVDELVLETGIALKKMRIGTLKRIAREMERAFYIKLGDLVRDPSYERLKDISSELRELLKQIAVEKEEFAEIKKNIVSGELNIVATKVENFVMSVDDEHERELLKNEFEKIADKVVMQLTGNINNKIIDDKIIDIDNEEMEIK